MRASTISLARVNDDEDDEDDDVNDDAAASSEGEAPTPAREENGDDDSKDDDAAADGVSSPDVRGGGGKVKSRIVRTDAAGAKEKASHSRRGTPERMSKTPIAPSANTAAPRLLSSSSSSISKRLPA